MHSWQCEVAILSAFTNVAGYLRHQRRDGIREQQWRGCGGLESDQRSQNACTAIIRFFQKDGTKGVAKGVHIRSADISPGCRCRKGTASGGWRLWYPGQSARPLMQFCREGTADSRRMRHRSEKRSRYEKRGQAVKCGCEPERDRRTTVIYAWIKTEGMAREIVWNGSDRQEGARKGANQFADPIGETCEWDKGDKNMRGHIKLFTLQTVPQNAQQTARSRSADRCIYTLGRTESAPSDHMILKAPL